MVRHSHLLTDEHYRAFGAIIHQFAAFERLVEICIAASLGADIGITVVAISQLSYSLRWHPAISCRHGELGLLSHRLGRRVL